LLRMLPATSCSFEGSECACPQGESVCEIPYDPYSGNQPMLGDPLPEFQLEFEYTGEPIVIELGA
jgi:hypothetical protein